MILIELNQNLWWSTHHNYCKNFRQGQSIKSNKKNSIKIELPIIIHLELSFFFFNIKNGCMWWILLCINNIIISIISLNYYYYSFIIKNWIENWIKDWIKDWMKNNIELILIELNQNLWLSTHHNCSWWRIIKNTILFLQFFFLQLFFTFFFTFFTKQVLFFSILKMDVCDG